VPRGWEEALATIAFVYHFPPSELWAMEIDGWEVEFWIAEATKIADRNRHG
jgi:hypothetical protein